MRNSFIDAVTASARADDRIFMISGDAGFGVFEEFVRQRPRRFINVGVAEQNMISHAAGMALGGFKVFVYNIIPFVLYRCYEQVRNDICYQRLPVTLVGIGSGVTYSPQGMTHYAVEDLLLARSLPNLRVFSPIDPVEAVAAANYACRADGPVYVRLAKRGEPDIHKRPIEDITKPLLLQDGEDVAVLFYGSAAEEVMKANEALLDRGLKVKLISMVNVMPVDFGVLDGLLRGVKGIITVEEHFTGGGLGSMVEEWVGSSRSGLRVTKLGIANEYIHEIRTCAGMREHYGFSARHVAGAVEEMIKKERG